MNRNTRRQTHHPQQANQVQQVQQLQARLVKAQEELGSMTAEGSAGGGAVKAVATGEQKLLSIKVHPEVLASIIKPAAGQNLLSISAKPEAVSSEDVEMLEDLILTAVNEALEKSRALAQSHMGTLTGGLGIPGF